MEKVDLNELKKYVLQEIKDGNELLKRDFNSFNYKKLVDFFEKNGYAYFDLRKENDKKNEFEKIEREFNEFVREIKNNSFRDFMKAFKKNNFNNFKKYLIELHKEYVYSILDFRNENLKYLLNGEAFVTAKILNSKINREITTTQFRRFYEYVLKAVSRKDKTAYYQLNAFVDYSKNRGKAGEFFYELMERSLDKLSQSDYKDEEMQNFKLFLESILGFMPKN